jgi:sialidase-1
MHLSALLTMLFVFTVPLLPPHSETRDYVTVFKKGDIGCHTFRIPAIIAAKNGDLLAFAEGRRGGSGDSGDIDIVLRRSSDHGATWSKHEIIWDDGANTCGNPCPVLDHDTGTIHLLLTRNAGVDRESQIIDQTSTSTRTVWVATSTDHGSTWSDPIDITASVKKPNWTWYATGPGNGIHMTSGPHAGRLVIPCDHIEAGTKKYFSHAIVSDDHGATWRIAGRTPVDQVNECAVAELANGTLLLNMRNYDRSKRTRALSRSSDGGETWSIVEHHPELPEPICQASMIALHDHTLIFSNPADAAARIRMTIKRSDDEGTSWSTVKILHSGPSAYSSLVELPESTIGCLYECGEDNPYEEIRFTRCTILSPKKN